MTDDAKIKEMLEQHGVYTSELHQALLGLFIDIAGERLIGKEKVKYQIYKDLLERKVVKPEFMQTLYKLMDQAKEKL